MEMPELNEDIMEGDGETATDVTAAVTTPDTAVPADGEETPETKTTEPPPAEPAPAPAENVDDETMDSSDIPKPPEEEPPQEEAPPVEETREEVKEEQPEEPPSKKAKVEPEPEEPVPEEEETPAETPEKPPVEAPKPDPPEEKTPTEPAQPDTDMLSTLASAALNQDDKEEKAEPPTPPVKEEATVNKKKEQWHCVGVFEGNTTIVTDYVAAAESNDEIVDVATMTLGGRRITLEPGTAYKLRVCAVNACGAGPWSEVAAFKTTLPGFPGAPSAIKISKSADGAHLTWEPPGGNSGEILEYAVYLAVRSASQGSQPVSTNQSQLAFVRVFCGPTNKCVVGPNSLQAAHIDTTTKPAIIFRIAARNAKGYGPATQVRWLQESVTPATPGASTAVKRAGKV